MKTRHYSLLITHCLLLIVLLFGCSSIQKAQESEEDLGDAYIQMGAMFFVDQKFDIAMEQFQKALKEDIKKYGRRHSKVARDYFNIGTVYLAKGNITEGKSYYEKVKDICADSSDKICLEVVDRIEHNLRIVEQRRVKKVK